MAMNKANQELTKQMKEVWEEHHDPEKREERKIKRRREERIENRKKDWSI